MDLRLTPCNGRVAATPLRGKVDAALFTDGVRRQVIVPLTNLYRFPRGPRDRQLLIGDTLTVYEHTSEMSYVQSHKDDYCGYVASSALGAPEDVTHWVSARSTHAYASPSIKSVDVMSLSFGSQVVCKSEDGKFIETNFGFIPKNHLSLIGHFATDPIEIAQQFLGTPYLWGGNSSFGIDCSGLVQASYLACGLPCQADSDLQCVSLGTSQPPNSEYQKGDLLFWAGHVALALNPETMIHATAHYMSVVLEDIRAAISRIDEQGEGPLLAHKRP
ncbi:MAG: NlpC/P60 family protein [Paracoccaceae bacterium]